MKRVVEQAMEEIDIVEVLHRHIPLEQKGSIYRGTCPFHPKKPTVLCVHPKKQSYYCYHCGAQGNILSYFMYTQSKNFWSVAEELSDEFDMNVRIPKNKRKGALKSKPKGRNEILGHLSQTIDMLRYNMVMKRFGHIVTEDTLLLKVVVFHKDETDLIEEEKENVAEENNVKTRDLWVGSVPCGDDHVRYWIFHEPI